MIFCRAVQLNGGSNYGEFGNCGCFGVNAVGISLLLLSVFLARAGDIRDIASDCDMKALLNIASTNKLVYYAYYGTISMQLLLSSILLLAAGILFDVEGSTAITFFIDQVFRILGWILSFAIVKSVVACESRVLYALLGWGLCQVATAGMNCIYYGTGSEDMLTSLSLVGYFIVAIAYLVCIVYQILRSSNDRSNLSSPLLCGGRSRHVPWDNHTGTVENGTSRCHSADHDRLGSTNESVDPQLLDSLFVRVRPNQKTAATQGRMQSTDSSSSSLARLGGGISGSVGGVGSVGFDFSMGGDCSAGPSGASATAFERGISVGSDAPSVGGGGSASAMSSPFGRQSSQRVNSSRTLLRRENYFPGDTALSVVGWIYFDLNGTSIASYSLEWTDRSGFKSGEGTKRLDELLFLREKISAEFPQVTPAPVPLPPPKLQHSEVDSDATSAHAAEMETYLSNLMAHPIAGKLAWMTLCDVQGGIAVARSFTGRSVSGGLVPGGSVLGRDVAGSLSGYLDSVPVARSVDRPPSVLESDAASEAMAGSLTKGSGEPTSSVSSTTQSLRIPQPTWLCRLHSLAPSGQACVSVTGYTTGVALESSRDKTMFLVSVSHEDSAEARGRDSSSLAFTPSYHTVKKRFKQFRGLHSVLQTCDERFNSILFPSTSKVVDVETDEEFDAAAVEETMTGRELVTMNRSKSEIVAALDCYLKAILNVLPRPVIVDAFLETDIHQCGQTQSDSAGFDIIFVQPTEASNERCAEVCRTVRTSAANFEERSKLGETQCNIFQASDGMVLPIGTPPLNCPETQWQLQAEESGPEVVEADKLLDVLGLTTASSPTVPVLDAGVENGRRKPQKPTRSPVAIVLAALQDLMCLVDYVGAGDIDGGCSRKCVAWPDADCAPPDSSEFLEGRGIGALNCMSTSSSSEVFAEGKDGAYPPFLSGVWVNQLRLRRLVTSTSAYADFCLSVSMLSDISLKSLRKCSDFEKNSFLLNLYNLISLHASIMLPWPHVKDRAGRVRWQQLARYDIGGSQLSLLHIEYAFIRSRLHGVVLLPSVPGSTVPTPTRADVKNSSNLAPGEVDVRELMALSLPHRSSNSLHIYSSDTAILSELHNLVAAYLVNRIRCFPSQGRVFLPKFFRRHKRDIMLWRKDADGITGENYRPSLDEGGCGDGDGMTRSSVDEAVGSRETAQSEFSEGSADRQSMLDIWIQHCFSPPAPCTVHTSGPYSTTVRNAEPQVWSGTTEKVDTEDSSAWDTIAADTSQPPPLPPDFPFSEKYGDDAIEEELLTRMRSTLHDELEIKDRQYHFRTYKDCFLGRDAVESLRQTYTAGKSALEAAALGNMLMEFGIIEHVMREHWLKNKEFFYTLSEGTSLYPEMTPFQSFLMHHLENATARGLLEHQVSASLDLNYMVTYIPDDFRFNVHVKKNTSILPVRVVQQPM